MRVQLGLVQEGTWSFSRARVQAGTVQKAGGILSPQDLYRRSYFKDQRSLSAFHMLLRLIL